jgi:phosphoribosylamine-glycine ligase
MSEYVVIVDPLSTGQEYAPAFRAAGRIPIAVISSNPNRELASSWHPENFDRVHHFDGDIAKLAAELAQYDVGYLVPGTESGVLLTDQLIEILAPGTGNVPELTLARRDKWQMAKAVEAAGIPQLRQLCTDDAAIAGQWLQDSGLLPGRLVIKPPRSGSGNDVFVVDENGWRDRFDYVLGRTNPTGLPNEAVLIQEYAEGTEYLVDTYSVDGVHSLVDVCRYTKTSRGDKIGIYQRIDFLDAGDPEVEVVWPYVQRVLDAVGVRVGCGHTEVMVTPDGPRLIETAARPAGGGHQLISDLATGDNHVKRTVAHRVRGEVRDGFQLIQQVRGVFVSATRTGYWNNREVLDGIRRLKSFHWMAILRDPGTVVPETVDLSSCLAWVVLLHSDPATLNEDYQKVRKMEAAIIITPA